MDCLAHKAREQRRKVWGHTILKVTPSSNSTVGPASERPYQAFTVDLGGTPGPGLPLCNDVPFETSP